MLEMNRIFFLMLTFALIACEGFKVLVLNNASGANATVTIKPRIEAFTGEMIHNYPRTQPGDSLVLILPADSSLLLLSTFTSMMGGVRIKPHDMKINYLRVETQKDTILAETKEQILDLLRDPRTRYRPRTDKPVTNGRNFGNIMIR